MSQGMSHQLRLKQDNIHAVCFLRRASVPDALLFHDYHYLDQNMPCTVAKLSKHTTAATPCRHAEANNKHGIPASAYMH
jgi:hypothetical protein